MLSELDLKLTFERRGTLREDVEDQTVSIEHARLESYLEVALLPGTQRLVDEDELRARLTDAPGEFFDLAAADEVTRVRTVATRLHLGDDLGAGGFGEGSKLLSLV